MSDTSGPAFPQSFIMHQDEVITSGNLTAAGCQGLSLRDYFAGQALIALAKGNDPEFATQMAYVMADAMLERRRG